MPMKIERSRLFFVFLVALFPAFAYSMPTQGDDAGELLKRVVANLKANESNAQNYAFTEEIHDMNYDKNGKIKVDTTAKYESDFRRRNALQAQGRGRRKTSSRQSGCRRRTEISGHGGRAPADECRAETDP